MKTIRARVLTPASPTAVRWIPDAAVTLDGDRIVAVEPWDHLPSRAPADLDVRPAVVTPGFTDGHIHYPQTRIVGAASGPLLQWLDTSTFPEEERFADPVHADEVAGHFVDRLLGAGTTTAMIYGSVHTEASAVVLERLDALSMAATVGPVLMDCNSPQALIRSPDRALGDLEALADRWADHPSLRVAVIPRFALSCSAEMLRRAGELAERRGLWVSTHLSENTDECRIAREMFGTADYLQIYEDAGLVHERSVYAHCIHLSHSEWDRFHSAGAVVAHCPDSNDFLGSGGMPTATVLERQIPMVIGTDVAAGRTFRVPRILSSAYDNALRQGLSLTPAYLLWSGTAGGAASIGFSDVGKLEAGYRADMVALDVPAWAETAEEVLGWVVFDHDCRVSRTWIAGQEVWNAAGGTLAH